MNADDDLDIGPCCVCEGLENVRNIVTLDKKCRVPGTGWGCVVCHVPFDGAVAVVCDDCMDVIDQLRFAVDGLMTSRGRVPISELTEPFEHDLSFHADELGENIGDGHGRN